MSGSYEIKLWAISTTNGRRGTTYRVRWAVAGKRFSNTFTTQKLADSFRAKLLSAARDGLAFDTINGLPPTLAPIDRGPSWYQHACDFVDMKWPRASARHRKSIADGLTSVTVATLPIDRTELSVTSLRRALYTWAFNSTARKSPPGTGDDRTIKWIEDNSVSLTELNDPVIIRRVLDALAIKLDGKAAAPTTIARKRAVFHGALSYAVELKRLPSNPIDAVRWKAPVAAEAVDHRVVVNPAQARRLFAAVREIDPALEAFYACLYFAALRPAEALNLSRNDCHLPPTGWGQLTLTGSIQQTGTAWGNDGTAKEKRGLKHRSPDETRPVPACPELVTILRHHLRTFGTGADGRLFVTRTARFGRPISGPYSNPISTNTYSRVWRQARDRALTGPGDALLARRPYDLRHAGVSLWLNAGVPATQVAEWAGHSVNVLLRVYAKCVHGQDAVARQHIETALGGDPPEPPPKLRHE